MEDDELRLAQQSEQEFKIKVIKSPVQKEETEEEKHKISLHLIPEDNCSTRSPSITDMTDDCFKYHDPDTPLLIYNKEMENIKEDFDIQERVLAVRGRVMSDEFESSPHQIRKRQHQCMRSNTCGRAKESYDELSCAILSTGIKSVAKKSSVNMLTSI